jgi:hypothetical protein
MQQSTYRVVKGVLIAIVACGVGIYTTVHRNSIGYQEHPIASIFGSVIPGIIIGFASYWWDGWQAKRKQGEPFPFAKACFVLLGLILLVLVIFGVAILAAISDGKMTNKNNKADTVAQNVNNTVPNNANEKEKVAAEIQVFDVSLFSESDLMNGTNFVRLTNLQGRVKNGSSKIINAVAVKLLIFDSGNTQIDTISVDVVGGLSFDNKFEPINAIGQPSQLAPNDVKPFKADVPLTLETRIPIGFRYSYSVDANKVNFKP